MEVKQKWLLENEVMTNGTRYMSRLVNEDLDNKT